jgi:putative thioredoxin
MNAIQLIARLALALALVSGLAGCGKIKQGVEEALKKAKEEGRSAAARTNPAAASASDAGSEGHAEIRQVSAQEYPAFVATQGRVVVVDFYADWCGPCRTLGPSLERVVNSFGSRVALGKVNVDQAKQVAAQAGVTSIPDVRIFVDGKAVDQFVGLLPEDDLRARIYRQVKTLPAPTLDPTAPADPSQPAVNPITPMEKDWLPPGIERR